jgi:hypothetical protein
MSLHQNLPKLIGARVPTCTSLAWKLNWRNACQHKAAKVSVCAEGPRDNPPRLRFSANAQSTPGGCRTHLCYLNTLRLAELGDALDVLSVGASPELRLLYPGCMFCRFVVYWWCLASGSHLGWLIAFGRRQTLRFRIQIKVL